MTRWLLVIGIEPIGPANLLAKPQNLVEVRIVLE